MTENQRIITIIGTKGVIGQKSENDKWRNVLGM